MKCNENSSKGSGGMEQTRNSRINPITLSQHSQVMGSALCLTEINISVKLIENCLKGSGDMEHTPNSKGKTNDLELCL